MKTTLLTSALVLGMSSAAFAAPTNHEPVRAPYAPQLRPHEDTRRPRSVTWTSLSKVSSLQRKQTIGVGGTQAYSKLKLEGARGNTFVDKLVIVFGNGARQVVELDQNVTASTAPLVIDLDGKNRRIAKVVVYGKSNRRAAINVLAT